MQNVKSLKVISKKHYSGAAVLLAAVLLAIYWFSLPNPLFRDPVSSVLEARDGNLLGARIAKDGQWRFPFNHDVPENFSKAIVTFEDKRFYSHPGFDPFAFGRALSQNLKNGSIVSGGSTLSMQVIRLARKGKPRAFLEKILEVILATRLELRHSKKDILALYASNAPFGGNVVGIDAAAWRYFGKKPSLLSWAEAATLAVLPNSPSLIHPGKNRSALLEKRNRLLGKLLERSLLDTIAYQLALEEPLPDKPRPLPNLAPHLLDRVFASKFSGEHEKTKMVSTIDATLQNRVNKLCQRKAIALKANEINNLAVMVLNVEQNEVMAYVGNAPETGEDNGEAVDIIKAPRSTGSILKPLLYALMLQEGEILPSTIIPDVPTQLHGYRPENFMETYNGMVATKTALVRSLNVPFVRMLQQYGVDRFHHNLKNLGLTTLNSPPSHYGLTLILGGAEGSLWDIANVYAGMARTLNHFYPLNGNYLATDFDKASMIKKDDVPNDEQQPTQKSPPFLTANAIYFTFEAMHDLERPNAEGTWESFESTRAIAWKTGTSFGNRDAWAIGVTTKYVVGVWVGNADGEGWPGLVGVQAAAPLLFDVFNLLDNSKWFDPPYDEMLKMEVCKQSGYPALELCEKETVWAPLKGNSSKPCPYHQLIHLEKSEQYQVTAECEIPSSMVQKPWFVLPPLEEFYYKPQNPNYKPLPPFRSDCLQHQIQKKPVMELIYPKNPTKIYVPLDLDGSLSRTVFKIAHRNVEVPVYWHIDNQFIGTTTTFHEMALSPSPGKHQLVLLDESGNRLELFFEILPKST